MKCGKCGKQMDTNTSDPVYQVRVGHIGTRVSDVPDVSAPPLEEVFEPDVGEGYYYCSECAVFGDSL